MASALQALVRNDPRFRDWANLTRYRDLNKALPAPASGESRVVFMGDSITDGAYTTWNGNDRWTDDLAARLPFPVYLSYDFADVLSERGSGNAEVGTDEPGSAFPIPRSAFGGGRG
jgi:hypothetical protein